ncbi:MAG: CDP-alcohol phosphatidyltransferase family protein [Planctomycetota bacterium]
MNLANRVTLGRLLFAGVSCLFLLLVQERIVTGDIRHDLAWWALAFSIAATASDALDGYIARRDNTVTAFGRVADPFVDKIIVCGSFVLLLGIEESAVFIKPWMVVLILFREFLVTGIRGYMESVGIDFGADMAGKIKMVVQSILVGFLIGVVAFREDPVWLAPATWALVWSTVAITVYSGTRYVARAARAIGRGKDAI